MRRHLKLSPGLVCSLIFEWVRAVTDAGLQLQHLRSRAGSLSRIAGYRRFEITHGPERGEPVIEVATGGGLTFEIRPRRSFDMGRLAFNGVPYGWESQRGLAGSPKSLADHVGGFFFTCGFDHIRQPEDTIDPVTGLEVAYPLHGNLPFTTAQLKQLMLDESGARPALICTGELVQTAYGGAAYRLERRYEARLGDPGFRFFDKVTNVATRPLPFMAMYHINFGYPLVGEQTVLRFADGEELAIQPVADEGENDMDGHESWNTVPARREADGLARVCLLDKANKDVPAVEISFDTAALPWLQVWRNREAGTNILSIEPTSNRRVSRAELLDQGEIRLLEPGESVQLMCGFSFSK